MRLAHHKLEDGTRILFRHIRPDDKGRLSVGLQRLSPESRHRRFLVPKPRFSSSELRYLTEIDGFDHVAIVAVSAEDPDTFYGVARFVRLKDDPQTAEAAIVVADPLQGKGLGSRLMQALVEESSRVGIKRLSALMAEDNEAIARLLAKVPARFERDEHHDGVREVVVSLLAA